MRVADILDRLQDSLEDPLLLFLHRLLICVDFEAAAAELSRCADVFASDFFLAARGEDFAAVGDEVNEQDIIQIIQILLFIQFIQIMNRVSWRMLSCLYWRCYSPSISPLQWIVWR